MRTIALEEHFASPGFIGGAGRAFKDQLLSSGPRGAKVLEQLCDLGEKRISEMNAAGIDLQVLSLNYPGVEQLEADEAISTATEANDFLAEVVKNNPDR